MKLPLFWKSHLLWRLVGVVGGKRPQFKEKAINDVSQHILQHTLRTQVSFGGCLVLADPLRQTLFVIPEARATPLVLTHEAMEIWWQHRLRLFWSGVTAPKGLGQRFFKKTNSPYTLQPLGKKGWQQVPSDVKKKWHACHPPQAAYGLPAVFEHHQLVSALYLFDLSTEKTGSFERPDAPSFSLKGFFHPRLSPADVFIP